MKTALLLSGKNIAWKFLHPSVALVLIFLFLASASSAPAALKTWLGTGGTGNWSTSGNWSPSGAPANGDDLSFPAGAGQLLNTNNLVRSFSSIAFSGGSGGYIIRGNAITLTNGLTAAHTAGLNTVDITITNGASQTITATTGGTLAVTGDIVFNGFNLTINNTVAVNLAGLLSGTGNLTKNGSGNLLINGSVNNTYTGTTTVNNGTLELNDTASATAMVPGDLTINSAGTVLLTEGSQIADTAGVTVNGGLFNLNGFSETIATLTMTAGTVSSGVGTLTCGNITTLASATQATIN
ncbi:MAG: autotransporter-associated beta strand repeat-containing protein, partial [Verrucomicrobiota bacterium]